MNKILRFTSVILMTLSCQSLAQQVSPAMIEQLKSLPKAQQIALAKQYGVDLDSIMSANTVNEMTLAQPGQALMQKPTFDEEVNDTEKEEGTKLSETVLPIYGQDLFNRDVSTFSPTDNASVSDDYRLGVGDDLVIQLFGKDNQSLNLTVNRAGEINFPQLGPIQVAGLDFKSATELIQTRVTNQLIGVQAVVSLGRLRAINIFMAGEVKVPGAYSVSAMTTVSQALFQASGITSIGSLRDIHVKRQGKTVATFDVYDLLMRGDAKNDVRLRSGDVVFVPTYNAVVTLEGELKRPMRYELQQGETLSEALKMAGGFSSDALNSSIVLIKKSSDEALPIAINIDTSDEKQINTRLNDGDIVKVLPISNAINNAISLKGAVVREGNYGWESGMRVSDIIGDIRRDLERSADLKYSLIIREKNSQLDIEVKQFSIVNAIVNKGTEDDPLLQKNDQILVFDYVALTEFDSVAEAEAEAEAEASRGALLRPIIDKLKAQAREGEPIKVVSVSGAVKSPGEYPLGLGYTVADLVLAAGGLKDSAYLQSVELRRITETVNGEINASYTNVDISSSNKMSAVSLQSRDHINVRENSDWNPIDSVVLEGEVKFPGTYLIQDGETISDVLKRAGGLTSEAFAEGAIFTREALATKETLQAKQFADSVRRDFATSVLTEETINSTYAEIQAVTAQLEEFEGQGRLLIDLVNALRGDTLADIQMENGDKLVIPKMNKTITVIGEVRRQGTHSYQQSLSLDDYIALSAGTTKRADDDGIYIIKANGAVVIPDTSLTYFSEDTNIAPGDTVVIPVNSGYKDQIPLWRDITQIIYQGTVAIAAVARL